MDEEYKRNKERYSFLKWAQKSFNNFSVVPPGMGICHQVNLEYFSKRGDQENGEVFPDTLVGTDSHTPMVNGIGVVAWGVGGIEAEAAIFGPTALLYYAGSNWFGIERKTSFGFYRYGPCLKHCRSIKKIWRSRKICRSFW